MESDTFYIPTYYCGIRIFSSFINYDVVEHYERDSTKTSSILFTTDGTMMPLPPYDTLSIFLRVKNKNYKYKYFVRALQEAAS